MLEWACILYHHTDHFFSNIILFFPAIQIQDSLVFPKWLLVEIFSPILILYQYHANYFRRFFFKKKTFFLCLFDFFPRIFFSNWIFLFLFFVNVYFFF